MLSELRTGHGTPRGGAGTLLEEKAQVLGTRRQLTWGTAHRGGLPRPWQARLMSGRPRGRRQVRPRVWVLRTQTRILENNCQGLKSGNKVWSKNKKKKVSRQEPKNSKHGACH